MESQRSVSESIESKATENWISFITNQTTKLKAKVFDVNWER